MHVHETKLNQLDLKETLNIAHWQSSSICDGELPVALMMRSQGYFMAIQRKRFSHVLQISIYKI
jgi:hypothetical protein